MTDGMATMANVMRAERTRIVCSDLKAVVSQRSQMWLNDHENMLDSLLTRLMSFWDSIP